MYLNCRIWNALHKHKHKKYCVRRENNIAPTDIMQVTGNKNVNSINNYAETTITKQKDMSEILSTNNNTDSASKKGVSSNTNPQRQVLAVGSIRRANLSLPGQSCTLSTWIFTLTSLKLCLKLLDKQREYIHYFNSLDYANIKSYNIDIFYILAAKFSSPIFLSYVFWRGLSVIVQNYYFDAADFGRTISV